MASIFERESAAGLIEPKQQIEDLARRSKVPVNVLLSAAELGGARDDAERIKIAESVAAEFGPRVQAGESVKALIREAAGNDEAASAFISRAKQIAEEMYPDQVNAARASKAATQTGGMGTALGVGVDALQQGYGSAIEGLGKATGLEGVEKYGADVAARNKAQIMEAAPGLTGVDEIDGIGSAAKFAGETFAQQIPQLGVSIGAGVAGAKAGGALGAMLGPGGAAAGAVIGGIGGGVLANIPYFYGSNRERQKESVDQGIKTEIDEGAAFLSSIPQAALDTIVDRLMVGAIAGPMAKAGGGLLTRAGMGAAQGIVAEVPTEIGQSMIERYQAGLPLDTEDAIAEYRDVGIAAGLIGGTLGGVGGAIQSKPPAGPMRSALDKSGATQRQFPEDAEGQAATLGGPVGVSPLAPTGAPVQVPQLFPDQKPGKELRLMDPETGEILDATFLSEGPEGVQVRIAGGIVDLSPEEFDASVSAAKQTEEAAKPAKGGKKAPKAPKVALTAADAPAFPAEPEPMAESGFDAPAAALQEQGFYDLPQDQWDGVTPEPAPVFDEPAPEPDMGPDTAAADALKEQGFYDLSETAAPKTPRGPKPAAPDFTPDEALKRAKQIEDTASRGGWNARLKKKHAELMAIVEAGNATDNLGIPSPENPVADQGNFTGPQEADRGDVAQAEGPSDTGGNGLAAVPGAGKDMAPASAEPEPFSELTKPRAPVAPITTTLDERIQPDMLGGAATTETEMAKKERTKREWGQYLAIAEKTKSPWDGVLDGRTVTVRPDKVKIRAKADGPSDLDYTIDTAGMDRDEIAARTRGALNELDRVSPLALPAPAKALPPPAASLPTPAVVAATTPAATPVDASPAPDAVVKTETASVAMDSAARWDAMPAIEREAMAKAAGWQTQKGGLNPPGRKIVSRAWADQPENTRATLNRYMANISPEPAAATPAPTLDNAVLREDAIKAQLAEAMTRPAEAHTTKAGKALRGFILPDASPGEAKAIDPYAFRRVGDVKAGWFVREDAVKALMGDTVTAPTPQEPAPSVPAAADIKAAAKVADKNPTDAQKEAGNYQKGHVKWAGLDITIENAKGSLRKGKDRDGNEWSVKMPAHYGYIKRTVGADGDHLDVYMGDKPESDLVVVVDQVDADTNAFDEHKVLAGFENRKTALDFYVQGFSDGKGADRLGAHKVLTVAEFKDWATNGDTKKPVRLSEAKPSPAKAEVKSKTEPATEPKPAAYGASNTLVSADRAAELRKRLQDKLKNQLNAGIDPEMLAMGAELAVFHIEAGARRFVDLARAIASDLGATTEQLRPYLRGWYNGARDTMQDSGISIEGMDDADAVARAVGAMAQAEIEPDAMRAGTQSVTTQRLSSDDVARITTDAKTFQYKDNADESGITERLQGVAEWDEVSAMGGIVYQYADGRMVVADGHQRLGLAKRLQSGGTKTPWTVAIYRQADGFTPENVRNFAALKNIREGSGTAIDAAKVLRASPKDPDIANLPPKSALVRDARALAKLSDDAFGMVINEVATIGNGVAVGSKVSDQKAHKDVLGLLVKLKPANQRQAEMIAEQAASATTTEVQTSLFGDEEVSESLYLERAKVLDNALSRIRQDRATFKVLADRAGTIAEEGNVLNQEANARRVDNDARVQAYLTAEANRKGPISDALTAAARKLKSEPRSLARITDEFIKTAGGAQLDVGRNGPDGATDDRAGGAAENLRPEARDTGVERDPAQDSDRGNQTLNLLGDEQPMFEPGADGLAQAVIPGAERSEDQRLGMIAETKRREAETKQAQSKIRRGDQKRVEDDEGGLFGEPKRDLFDAPASVAKPSKIEDFGEKIGGARKDVWSGFKEKMQDAEGLDAAAEPLSKSWPEPDYEKLIEGGIDPWTVGFIRAARDMIPRKPSKSWKLKGWAEQVTALRRFASDLLTEKIDQDKLKEKLADSPSLDKKIGGRIALYEAVGHSKSLKDLSFGEHTYSMFEGERFENGKSFWEVTKDQAATAFNNFPKTLARSETREGAIEKFKAIFKTFDQDAAPKGNKGIGTKFLIYSQRGDSGPKYRIGVKIGSNYIDLRNGIADVAEARRIVADEADQLQAKLDRMRDIPNERKDENAPRIGADHRNGADVTPQQFAEAFGFRGVEFGNWVEDARRQEDLNNAYDAMMDLASILDLPPKAMSLNGSLGLAFGARGSGGKNAAAAHYEPGKVVINLTKRQGRGSLAHEWFHALDNYFARKREQMRGKYITDNSAPSSSPINAGIRPEVVQAFSAVKRAILETELRARSQNMDKLRSDPYWGTGIEMHARAFESYVIAKLEDQGGANDYLANVVNGTSWAMLAEMSGLGDSYPYLKPGEIEVVRPKFDALFQAIETRETDRGTEMYMRGPDREPVATLTGNELGAWEDIRQLGKKAETWYRNNLVGKTVKNKAGGILIGFNGRGARKIGGRKGADIYRSVVALRDILADGQIIETRADKAGRENVKAIHKIAASVSIAGQTVDLVATVREMKDGTFHYDLSKDFDGEAKGSATLTAQDESRASALEGGLADVNIDFAHDSGKAEEQAATDADLAAITRELNAEVSKTGIGEKVTVRVVKALYSRTNGLPSYGRFESVGHGYRKGEIAVSADVSALSEGDIGPIDVMRHEIIHAMRSEALWNRPFGLFTGPEWRGLAVAAKADAGIREDILSRYPDLPPQKQTEEMVAELYRLWAAGRDVAGPVARALEKAKGFLMALANALRGRGFVSAARTMEQIANGKIGGRGPQGPGGGRGKRSAPNLSDAEMRGGVVKARAKFSGLVGSRHWKNPGELISNTISDAMTGKGDFSLLALVPGRALFSELGKRLPSVKAYLHIKEEMDSLRNDWHSKADETAQKWLKLRNKMPRENDDFMDLMHRTTLAGIDPSQKDDWKHAMEGAARNAYARDGEDAPQWVFDVQKQIEAHRRAYATLRELFDALPSDFQSLYSEVRANYDKLGDDFEAAVLENIRNATKIGLKRAQRSYDKEMERIQDEGLEGEELEEAVSEAERKLKAVKQRGGFTARARINTLRKVFESNRLKGPYFPLARFGDYFVTIRDDNGKVVSFSRFEKESQQQAFIREQKDQGADRIQFGVVSNKASLKSQVDPTFVADVENMLAEAGADDATMDAVWQRWLETLPDQSIRTSKIHRKGRQGWNTDAYRAFGKHMFHGAHQLARLKYGILLEDHVDEAEIEAKQAQDPNRAMQVVNEVRKRHEFTMNPSGSSAVASLSSLAFVWYLGATPAAALANISQTTVVGVPLMTARFRKSGVSGSLKALGKASADFMRGRGSSWDEQWTAENSPNLTHDERAAMKEAIRRGTIDKTQAHDLASVAETGIEYNAVREKWMRRIGWFFHHAERFNREVTFLASYRLAKDDGLTGTDAIDAAADLTWKIHFDYQNTSRPRFMQNDLGKVLTTFRQFSVNMLWRLARDMHQSLKGATPEERSEARLQLAGITLSMMAHAGIRGTWGYGLAMMLLGILTPGADDDDIEEWMQDALLMEGDSAGVAAWNFAMGAALNGAPGQILGVDLKERIGMPNMWFRGPSYDMEGADLYNHYVQEVLGPVSGIGLGFFRGAELAADGEVWRGVEAAVPKVLRDAMKAGRYSAEGVTTLNGDTILENMNPYQVLMQASGFTPAQVSERYDINTRLKNEEKEILDRRRDIHRAAGESVEAGNGITEKVLEKIRAFNRDFPEYPITADTLRQSMQSRARAHEKAEFGVTLNQRLNDRLRSERATPVYN